MNIHRYNYPVNTIKILVIDDDDDDESASNLIIEKISVSLIYLVAQISTNKYNSKNSSWGTSISSDNIYNPPRRGKYLPSWEMTPPNML